MSFSDGLSNFFGALKHTPMERKIYSIISPENVLGEAFDSDEIRPNEDYFSIRLCEMYLTDRREYFREFVPMAISVNEFRYDKERQTIPFLVDNRMLGLENQVEGEHIEFKNTRVAGPFPYRGDDVAVFTGLFRLEASNMAKSLFNLLENLVKTFDPGGLSRYLSVAKPLMQSLPQLLKLNECEFRLGARDVYTETDGAANQFRQNYIAYVNCPEKNLSPGSLWVKKNRLFSGTDKAHAKPVKAYDYCLMKIERSAARNDYPSFNFYPLWQAAQNLILENAFQRAKYKKIEFLQHINNCPDLTEVHKEELIQLFHVKFDNLLNRQLALEGGLESGTVATRGNSTDIEEQISSSLKASAVIADNLELPQRIGDSLYNLGKTWKDIPFLDKPDSGPDREEPSDTKEKSEIINQQLAVLKKTRQEGEPDPSSLVEALTFGTLQA